MIYVCKWLAVKAFCLSTYDRRTAVISTIVVIDYFELSYLHMDGNMPGIEGEFF